MRTSITETGMLYSVPLVKNAWKPGPEWNTMDITRGARLSR